MSTPVYEKDLHFTKDQVKNHINAAHVEINETVDIAEIFIAGIQIDIDFKEKTVTVID